VLNKAHFWDCLAGTGFKVRQRGMINGLLNEFEGRLTSSKWAMPEKCSQDTALRDIEDLIRTGVLIKDSPGGAVRRTRSRIQMLSEPKTVSAHLNLGTTL
jgi:Fic family protein